MAGGKMWLYKPKTKKTVLVACGGKVKGATKRKYNYKKKITVTGALLKPQLRASFIPLTQTKKFRYVQTFALTTGLTGVFGADQVFRLNSMFDPDFTGGGHQPYTFDQMAAFYANYRVTNCKVSLIASTIGGNAELAIGVTSSTNSTGLPLAGSSLDIVSEKSNASVMYLSASGSLRVAKMTENFPLHTLYGVSATALSIEDNYSALVSTNPVQQAYLYVSVASPSFVSGQTCTVQVALEYTAHCYNRITQAAS